MSEHADVPGLQPDPESAEAVGQGGGGHVSSDASAHDMGGDIGPADEAIDPTEKLPDRPELDG
jgi:hypothetical protein